MQKNRTRTQAQTGYETRTPRRNGALPQPEIVTIDDLGVMLDEDLIGRLRGLEDEKNRAYESHMDTKPWEEEIAYIRREQQIRRIRRDTHADYVRKYEEEFARTEAHLPAGDFDNSAFVYAANGGRPRWN